jgi:hypothetical protein
MLTGLGVVYAGDGGPGVVFIGVVNFKDWNERSASFRLGLFNYLWRSLLLTRMRFAVVSVYFVSAMNAGWYGLICVGLIIYTSCHPSTNRHFILSTSSSHKTISVVSFNRVRTHTICLHIEEYRPLRIHILALAKRCARIGQTRQIKRVPGSTNSSELRHIRFLSSVVTIPYVVHKDDDISKPSESRSIARVETHSRVPKERLAAMPF